MVIPCFADHRGGFGTLLLVDEQQCSKTATTIHPKPGSPGAAFLAPAFMPLRPLMTQSPITYPAITISTALADHLTAPTPWRILSSHRHACNLINPQGDLLTLVTPTHGNGPFHMVTPCAALPILPAGATIIITPQTVNLPNFTLALQSATWWSPQLTWSKAPLSRSILHLLHEGLTGRPSPLLLMTGQPYTPLTRLAQPGLSALHTGLYTRDRAQLALGANRLAGLGPGLTPAGDDFLVGWMAGLWLFGTGAGLPVVELCALVAAEAAPRTTRLSAAWLCHAAAGRFGELWHGFAAACAEGGDGLRAAAGRIRDTGATSGSDALAGLLWGLQTMLGSSGNRPRQEPLL
jgi:hypothetical protein